MKVIEYLLHGASATANVMSLIAFQWWNLYQTTSKIKVPHRGHRRRRLAVFRRQMSSTYASSNPFTDTEADTLSEQAFMVHSHCLSNGIR